MIKTYQYNQNWANRSDFVRHINELCPMLKKTDDTET